MTEFRFGDIITMDYEPVMRLMALCPVPASYSPNAALRPGAWWALVLADLTWPVGMVVTTRPDSAGIQVVERAEAL